MADLTSRQVPSTITTAFKRTAQVAGGDAQMNASALLGKAIHPIGSGMNVARTVHQIQEHAYAEILSSKHQFNNEVLTETQSAPMTGPVSNAKLQGTMGGGPEAE